MNIDYIEGGKNYYSVDNGNTWIKYEKPIEFFKQKNIKAKSIMANKITRIVSKDILLQLAEDAIGIEAYDDNSETYAEPLNKYMKIGKDIIGDSLRININCPPYNHVNIAFYKNDKTTKVGSMGYWNTDYGRGDLLVTVPEESEYVKVITTSEGMKDLSYIYNIGVDTEPKGYVHTLYPNITTEGVVFKDKYTIKYFSTAVKKLYSYDNKDWYDYPEEGIQLKYNQTVYAKSIDKNGEESTVLQYKNTLTDILGKEVCDNDEETKVNALDKYIYVEDNMWNKKIKIKMEATLYSHITTYFLDKDKKILDSFNTINQSVNKEVEIPEGTKWITFKFITGDRGTAYVYEIKVIK